MVKHLKYLRYILRHKWFVFWYCLQYRLFIRAFTHDWTKFLPVEWFPYAERFYGHSNNYAEAMQHISYQQAWNHHQKSNDHHWQYWILNRDNGETLCLPMSDRARWEMLADWRGAGRALGKPDTFAWYQDNKDNIELHVSTRLWLEAELTKLDKDRKQLERLKHLGVL